MAGAAAAGVAAAAAAAATHLALLNDEVARVVRLRRADLREELLELMRPHPLARIALSCRQLGQRNQCVAAAMEAVGYAVPPPGDENADGPSSARGAAGAESQLQATSL